MFNRLEQRVSQPLRNLCFNKGGQSNDTIV
nr:MAG TPA: hypothetical protein [Caudoviricetes sp.]